jgi:hypothetical protein
MKAVIQLIAYGQINDAACCSDSAASNDRILIYT